MRFVYVHARDWYFSVDDRRDVIELPLAADLDVSGWEIRKALRLLRQSNPPLLEWLRSPLVYQRDEAFTAEFNALAKECYSPRRCFHHYLDMARGNWCKYLSGREAVSRKKYLYVFRPLLGCRWIERQLGPVPTEFDRLVAHTLAELDVLAELQLLVARKQAGDELAVAAPVEVLSQFIEAELARLAVIAQEQDPPVMTEKLDAFFRRYAQAA